MPDNKRMPFPGFPHFLELAAEQLEASPRAIRNARAQPAISQIATLISQCKPGHPVHPDAEDVMRDLGMGLKVAALAAMKMRQFLEPDEPTGGPAETDPSDDPLVPAQGLTTDPTPLPPEEIAEMAVRLDAPTFIPAVDPTPTKAADPTPEKPARGNGKKLGFRELAKS